MSDLFSQKAMEVECTCFFFYELLIANIRRSLLSVLERLTVPLVRKFKVLKRVLSKLAKSVTQLHHTFDIFYF